MIASLNGTQLEHLKMENMMSLASDGASVRTGKRNELVQKINCLTNKLISFHCTCVCHRLALSCVDSNDDMHTLYLCCGNHPLTTVEVLRKFTKEDIKVSYQRSSKEDCNTKIPNGCPRIGQLKTFTSTLFALCKPYEVCPIHPHCNGL